MARQPEDRPPLVVAMEWVSRVVTISLEMVLPAFGGYWLDRLVGTPLIFLIIGMILGFALGLWHLIRFAQNPP